MRFLKLEELSKLSTISVDEAAYVSGFKRTRAYIAVKNEEFFEVVRMGRSIRVLAQPLYKTLMGSALEVEE